MAEIRHLENRHDVIIFCRRWSDLHKISESGAEHVDGDDVVELETRCRIAIWRTFRRIQWHVIPEPPATLHGAAMWRIQCHESRATCHIARCKKASIHFLMRTRHCQSTAGNSYVSSTHDVMLRHRKPIKTDTLGHFTFWISLSLNPKTMYTHGPQVINYRHSWVSTCPQILNYLLLLHSRRKERCTQKCCSYTTASLLVCIITFSFSIIIINI